MNKSKLDELLEAVKERTYASKPLADAYQAYM